MAIVKWNPARELMDFQNQMNRLFDSFFGYRSPLDESTVPTGWAPAVDIMEKEDAYNVVAEVPGLKKEDIKINLKDNVLTLSGKREANKEIKEENYHRMERMYGEFNRSFRLPDKVDEGKISAKLENGILEIVLPKAEEAKPKQIEVKIK